MAGGAGGGFRPVVGLTAKTAAPHGGWSELQDPKAIRLGGYTYVGFVAGGSNGDIQVAVIEHATGTVTQRVLNSTLNGEGSTADMHNNPALLVRDSDHRLIAFYCDHGANDYIVMRISTTSLDTDPTLADGFASEVQVDCGGASVIDYPIAAQMLGWAGDPVFLAFRSQDSSTSRWLYMLNTDIAASGDDGVSGWSTDRWLYRNSGFTAYGQIHADGDSRVDFLFQNKNEGEVTDNELRHGYFDGTTFYNSDGSALGTHPLASPLTPSDLTLVDNDAGFHLFGLERDTASGQVAFTVSARVQPTPTHYIRRYLYTPGGSWVQSDIDTSPGTGGLASGPYSWGNVIDPDDFDRAIYARWASGVSELWEARLIAGTWTKKNLTTELGLATNTQWPIFIRDGVIPYRWVALVGSYVGYTDSDYQLAIYTGSY